ncbi:carboxymuconolactone decarboxylase family protein [Leucobacter sp. UT-8R-CII-1-4]|uniref:carboxymuconolactone decarboxylase family protein n=1 Tax=Leucobacter sp. UT-8R-CII-1-4 TaxID=3040075 RepID=UPI0024A81DA6|nr:carboxymuconolactone decarboxylase family protein [Leucobacter sp. UT-8R-CII-1-4]MDI6022720.1 carboxymuconolactone decarboxylase family protein [Leucobacter sp. UT-8R-CII-1-4]
MTRVNLSKQDPAVYQQLENLSKAAESAAVASGLDPKLIELIRLRISQINGCAFCCRLHARDAVNAGESADRLAVLAAWWESQYFSDTERAALALAEEVNELSGAAADDYESDLLDAAQVSAISWLAIVMGAWNRVAIRSGYRVAP